MDRLSQPVNELLKEQEPGAEILRADHIIVGSGYGGAVAAMRLAHTDRSVVVLERGREFAPGDFPYDESEIPSHLRIVRDNINPQGYADALFNLHLGEQTDVLVGSGLGGTSLINANVAETPQPQVFQKPEWPHEFRNDPAPLIDEFQRVREILSVSTHPQKDLPKYQALVRLTGALDAMNGVDASVRKAQVTVMFDDKANNVGVRQRACTDCGNCVTGCNVGAKGTLDRNILPLAKSRGARIYTGVTVLTLRERPGEAYRWLLCVTPTTPLKGTVRKNTYWMLAKSVILAAGTLGSTEILLRSQELEKLPLSNRLGERFSTNGDGLIMSYGQSSPVNAIASAEQQAPDVPNKVGPTITGIVDVSVSQSAGCGAHLTLEEAAIPAAVSRLFIEALTTSAQLQRLSNRKLPKFIKANKIDPLVGSRLAAQHSQVLLVMGDDGAAGNLGLSKVSDGEALESVIQIDFPDAQKNAALAQSNRLIKSQDRSDGLDGGQYAPNPLWEVLPEAASSVLSGDLPKGRAMTVHPLGGCAMGDDVNSGVVNHEGQVFRPGAASATATYEGLYVLDGAIIPAALEVNPFLTIAALAWRNVGRILVSRDEDESTTNQVVEAYRDVGDPPYSAIDEHAVDFTLQEQLVGQLSSVTPWFEARLRQGIVAAGVTEPEKVEDYLESDLKRLAQVDGLVMEVEAHLVDTGQWLESPGPVAATATLYVNMLGADDVRRMRPYGVSRTHIDHMVPFAKLEGRFTLLKEDHHNWFSDFFGAIGAILAYRKRRTTTKGFWRRPLREWMVFFNIGALQSRLRRMQYEFESDEVRISGEKVLGYNRSLERLWPALLYLPLEFRDKKHRKTTSASMAVALEDLVDSGFLQLASPANLPRAALTAAGVGGYFVRSIFSTSFWEFGGMDYPQTRVAQKTLPRAIKRDNGTLVEPEFKTINVQLRAGSEAHFPLLMSRYPNPAATRGPILLLHGLAQGSQIFWTESLDTNLAVFMYEAGYDVWMADYRLSNHVLPNIHDRDWSMDEIAAFDIPAIIHHVHDQTGRPVTIFAHCVGACTIAMSVLSGKTPSDRIKAVAANAIHPYVITSPANRVRAKLGSFYRDWITTDYLNPIPGPGEGAWQNFMDRLAFSAAKVRELALDDHRSYCDDGLAEGICDRMSLLYGRMWNHKNLDPRTHQAFVHLFGPAPGSVYRHIYYYSLLQRIAASNGENEYLQLEKIRDNWNFPTLFLHGEDSRVFNPYSAERSAIRLREIKPDLAVAFKRVADYGHMDIVFGKNAHKDVYGDVISFFDQPVSSVAPLKAGEVFIYRPNIGPILRAAWVRDGKLYLRFWAELKRGLTDSAVALAVKGDQVKAVSEVGVTGSDKKTGNRSEGNLPVRHRILDVEVERPEDALRLELYGQFQRDDGDPAGVTISYRREAWYRRMCQQLDGGVDEDLVLLVGSCRFPGTIIDGNVSDSTFSAMLEHSNSAHLLLLVGDQIYADATDELFQVRSLRAKFRYRYERAFSTRYSPNFAKLATKLPTHFALDDHEIEDEWSGVQAVPSDSTGVEKKRHESMEAVRQYGVSSARQFQSSGRDQLAVGANRYPSPFYYALDCPGETRFPLFVMDTRTEREFRTSNNPADHQLIGDQQYDCLIQWLEQAPQDGPKFIVSGSVVAPLPRSYVESGATWQYLDGWAGYPATLERLMAYIASKQIRHVIFIGGNEHFSATAKIELGFEGKTTDVWQIIGSGLYAPMPFANSKPGDFDWDLPREYPVLTRNDLSMVYTANLLSISAAQFLKVVATSKRVIVNAYSAQGHLPPADQSQEPVASATLELANGELVQTLVQSGKI